MQTQADQLEHGLQSVQSHEYRVDHVDYVLGFQWLIEVFHADYDHVQRDHNGYGDFELGTGDHVEHKPLDFVLMNTRNGELDNKRRAIHKFESKRLTFGLLVALLGIRVPI